MAGQYGIQYFHSAGTWEPLSAYQRMDHEKAMQKAAELAENVYARPLGLRVTGPRGWVSDRMGGRTGVELNYNPVTEVWSGTCTKCSDHETGTDVYAVTKFAGSHTCQIEGVK